MCGITGVFNYRHGQPVDRRVASRMLREIKHRGPDDKGWYFSDPAGLYLGHRRLSIIDLETGHQPMCNEDGNYWIVFNGEIYTYRELRGELQALGHLFRTRSDTETIVHAYEEWGLAALPRLNGMFGLAIWDEQNRTLILARDPFGIKPLYYWHDGNSLIFSSEIKPLLHHPIAQREVDVASLQDFLTLAFVPSPRTAFRGINKLLPGHALICAGGRVETRRYYWNKPEIEAGRSEGDLVEELRDKIETAVKRQMVSDVPVGAMLSGGVDSSAVATIMTEISGHPIKTFTMGFDDNFDSNEFVPARKVAQRIGSEHYDTVLSAEDYSELLAHTIWHMEEPVGNDTNIAFYWVCKLAREHVKVVLTGQGADEPFAGYPRHLGECYGRLYRWLPSAIRERIIRPLVECMPRQEQLKRAVRSLEIRDPLQRMLKVYDTVHTALKCDLFAEGVLPENDYALREAVALWQSDVTHLDGLSQMLYVDSRFSLADNLLMYGDKMSMAVSLEARVPFLDLELMQFVENLAPSFKIRGWTQKYLLKKALSKWLPKEILVRRKIGFATPVDDWFQSELHDGIKERLLDNNSACRQFFNPAVLQQMISDHQSRRQNYRRVLFSLLTFEIWHQQFIQPSEWSSKPLSNGVTASLHLDDTSFASQLAPN